MEGDLTGEIPCATLSVESILRLGTAGVIWGLCAAPYKSRKLGLAGLARTTFVAKSMGEFGFQCGLVGGLFSVTRCGIQRYRRKDDWVNAMIAGFIAGAAVAAGSRNWKQVATMAGLVSCFSVAADYSRTI